MAWLTDRYGIRLLTSLLPGLHHVHCCSYTMKILGTGISDCTFTLKIKTYNDDNM